MLTLTNIKKVFKTDEVETWALQNVNLEVKKGEFVAIMGPSGCGKSTLLNILGLLDTPTEGAYILDGKDVSQMSEDDRTDLRKGKLGFVFQSFNKPCLPVLRLAWLFPAFGSAGCLSMVRGREAKPSDGSQCLFFQSGK